MLRGIPPSFSKENLSKIIMKVKEKFANTFDRRQKSIENYGKNIKRI